jgi:hypothetical protein
MKISEVLNLALMKISTWHKAKGDSIAFIHSANFDLTDPPDKIY